MSKMPTNFEQSPLKWVFAEKMCWQNVGKFVVLFFTILSLCGCLISTNIVLSNTTRYENVVDGFPNQLVVECGVGMTDFKETKDSNG